MEKPFEGKVALITGGTRGIGRATALRLASMGADIVLNYSRNEADAKTVADEVKTLGVRAQCLRADIGDLDDLESLFTQVDADPGRLDFLVNSAARGLERPRDAMRSLPKHLRHTFEINVLGPWFAAKAAAPLMERAGGGAIVNLTSLGAQRYMPRYAAVGVTKGALDTLTRYLAVELAPKGIRVNGVCPSWVEETGGVRPLPGDYGSRLRVASPVRRGLTPDDVAGVVAFLCGPDAAMIIGQNIVVDGGLTLLAVIEP